MARNWTRTVTTAVLAVLIPIGFSTACRPSNGGGGGGGQDSVAVDTSRSATEEAAQTDTGMADTAKATTDSVVKDTTP